MTEPGPLTSTVLAYVRTMEEIDELPDDEMPPGLKTRGSVPS